MFYKGYIRTKGKQAIEKFKDRADFKTYDQIKNFPEFAGVLADDAILIDVDDPAQAESLMSIVEDLQLDCRVLQTSRGKHFLFRNNGITRNKTHTKTAIGLTVDIKVGCNNSIEVLKLDGEERFIEWDVENDTPYQEIPKWLFPVQCNVDFQSMDEGAGRNQALFNYILTLQNEDFTVEEIRDCIRLLNRYVLKEPLVDEELEVILRDDAFKKEAFFKDKTFLFDKFARYLIRTCNIVKVNNQLHVYDDGVYIPGYRKIEQIMVQHIPNLKKTQRREVLDYVELLAEPVTAADPNYIAFRNGVLHLISENGEPQTEWLSFSKDLILTNRIPWDYNPNAYSEVADKTLDKIACYDPTLRALLEEVIGACMSRSTRLEGGKAFILTGDKANGKSTYLDTIKAVLGVDNVSALDLGELGDRFSTSMLSGKLANIGDDIRDDFLQGSQTAIFKKIVTGNRIKAERKGYDPFEFEPYAKLLFSANDIPRARDRTGAVLRRLIIIPFDAKFSADDPDYDPNIKDKLVTQESIEYFIKIGIAGLQRITCLNRNKFTRSEKTQKQIAMYEEENNPIISFLAETEIDEIENEPTPNVYRRYTVFCAENNMQPIGNVVFTKQLCKRLNMRVVDKRMNGHKTRIYELEGRASI